MDCHNVHIKYALCKCRLPVQPSEKLWKFKGYVCQIVPWKVGWSKPPSLCRFQRPWTRILLQLCSATRLLWEVQQVSNGFLMLLHNIYHTLPGEQANAFCSAVNEVDGQVVNALIQMDDSGIILYLQQSKGFANSTTFDAFWNELQAYLDEITLAVDERQHGEALTCL